MSDRQKWLTVLALDGAKISEDMMCCHSGLMTYDNSQRLLQWVSCMYCY